MARIRRQEKRLWQELLGGILGLGGVFCLGIFWYWYVEGWSLTEAAYMTMITLATVGFSEVRPLDDRSRLFTMVLILLGIISIGYIVNRFTEAIIQGYFQERIRERQKRRLIESFQDHYIICGYGRMGHQVALEFAAEKIPFVIVDSDPESVSEAQHDGHMAVQGDATLDDCLLDVRIDRAACLVAALPSDAENLYTVLSAKTLNPQLRTIARANNQEAVLKLKRAGADAVVSPYITGGRRLAAAALRPRVMDFVDGIITGVNRSLYLDEFLLSSNSGGCVGQTLSDTNLRALSGALVLAIRREDGTLIGGPTGDTRLMEGDLLICMGTAEQLRTLRHLLGGTRPSGRWSKA
ncbi:potassium channel family protein [Spirulina subsalsa]|uniref:potassium channel family protein n=1 Tax=Spirulina subsalsa TaxID=54311 RepID=UPI0002E98773|nr:potassium channel protein [Spirulina subsalsa]